MRMASVSTTAPIERALTRSSTEEAAIRLISVVRRFPVFTFGPVDLEVGRGTVVGVLGVNGVGKSTLLRLLLGLVRPDAGRVEILGRHMAAEEAGLKGRVAFVSEDMAPYSTATVDWHIRFVRSLVAGWDELYAGELLRRFDLRPRQRVGELSRGQTMRLLILLALVRRPQLLILDEPTASLDPRMRQEVRDELAAAVRVGGATLLFSSHLTADVEALADDVVILDAGRIVRRAPVKALREEGPLEEVFLRSLAVRRHRLVAQ